MKKINTCLLAMTVLIIATISCKKESVSWPPSSYGGNNNLREITEATGSEWFSISDWTTEQGDSGSQLLTHNENVPEITYNLLTNGKVLVFAKGGPEMIARTLPFVFAQTAVVVELQPWNLKFKIAFSQQPQTAALSLNFRYVLIPSNKLVTNSNLDYNDYEEVCSYYNIPK